MAIARAADSIAADLALLNGSTQRHGTYSPAGPGQAGTGAGKAGLPPPDSLTGPLARPMTISFDGPLQQALEKVCAHAGLRLEVRGRPGPVPRLVHLRARDTSCLAILRDIGLQTGRDEQIRVVESAGLVELVWLTPALLQDMAADGKPGRNKARRGNAGRGR